jgi:hypothetical protein
MRRRLGFVFVMLALFCNATGRPLTRVPVRPDDICL